MIIFKAIKTKYAGPTNFKGSRVIASDDDGNSLIKHWDCELNPEQNHIKAAKALTKKMGWTGKLITGQLGNVYVHVFDGRY